MKFFAMHPVASAIANERISLRVRRKSVAPINGRAGRPGEITGRATAPFHRAGDLSRHPPASANHTPWLVRADAIDLRRRAIRRDAGPCGRHRIKRIPDAIALLKKVKPEVIAILASEAASLIIK